ncbi:dehydrogenase/reductase SDR family protein 1 [Bradyrhizobium elkanii]|uniref:Dehydrogenase/reductase SDR family protein 1 n=1 Tax=Bradyrhizobium elkanii TaxID=29448 RepID=A0A8I1Y355_BRAEL|nr:MULTISPECIES: SDR family NAD(P)-dependent oxidoreductase [Bradyrhizobium]MBP1291164.1 dehydrogenase/reductase SDR family protein 1 [Bradyrhizobium elkanii]MCP1928519.1 dehydrogenase/reductase SDR family protein 1 [Bradyrhizobium elkanii]MCS3580866.1 dehydrogenase/reductase SDR family protein 1 [Bradyrhizobium elkanii]MCS3723742.1 dehydrogenase/reductase SDR family protein 1 [Bradyrhizobium elkanii]MCS4008152.1 dehydrogenase/reductase SDR family protein 1 [Bradyrhizobium elkanii USDA 61]
MTKGRLKDRIALVTGGSRGVGKGVAIGLAEAGATVIVTARTRNSGGSEWPGSLDETIAAIDEAGGRGIGLLCDHSDDDSVQEVFDLIRRDHGRLDVLVNNVFAAPNVMPVNVPFWQVPASLWDTMHRVGLRSHFVASQLAVPLMLPQKRGLIVNTSSGGGIRYTFNVPFGVQKSGVDRMARDMAHELQPFGIAAVSIWPGYIKSEKLAVQPDRVPLALAKLIAERGETPVFAGRAVAALAGDPDVMAKSGQILLASELAAEYGFTDIDGKVPPPPSRDAAPLSVFKPSAMT